MLQSRMLVACVVLLCGLRVVSSDGNAIITNTAPDVESTSLQVMPLVLSLPESNNRTLDLLKSQLRRNNDDYNPPVLHDYKLPVPDNFKASVVVGYKPSMTGDYEQPLPEGYKPQMPGGYKPLVPDDYNPPALIMLPEKNNKTINTLQTQLQRNNDDYKNKSIKELKWEEESPKDLLNNNRRALNEDFTSIPSKSSVPYYPAPIKANHQYKERIKAKKSKGQIFHVVTSNRKAKKNQSQNIEKQEAMKREKLENLRSFLEKYKELVSNHTNSTSPQRQLVSVLGQSQPEQTLSPKGSLESLPPPIPPPSAYQLDMAPAHGSKIHILRSKNHLCHRHVLIPEGPKYDSKGKPYLSEYSRLHKRDYHETKPPILLLPKCCNCCRKSVLGCE